jgi:ATP-binding protein involved in chromosome partitioning
VSGLIQIGARPTHRAAFAKNVLIFTSGKGGVGKSTVAVNVAVALSQRGFSVGILDADVYGPSVPRLLSVHEERLAWNDRDRMVPAENFGVKIASVGLTTPDADTPLAWRSSVAISALMQLIDDCEWGELDYLLIDMPPGTGDVQLTMAQELRISGAVVITTPQMVATDDVRRAIRMLLEIGVPIAGVVENMSYFVAPDNGAIHRPFGEGGGRQLANDYGVPFLGELPLSGSIRACSDAGQPTAAMGSDTEKLLMKELAARLVST